MAFDLKDFLEMLAAAGEPLQVIRRGKKWLCRCPTCGKKALKISPRSGWFVCHYCRYSDGTEGPPARLLARALSISEPAARAKLYGQHEAAPELDLPDPLFGEEDEEEEIILPPRLAWRHHDYVLDDARARRGVDYLEGRGVPAGVARAYGIRYSTVDRRVMLPVEVEGRLVGWQGRSILPSTFVDPEGETKEIMRLLSSPGIPRDQVLMFQDRVEEGGHLILTEGPFDALKCHLVGGAVAAMGKTVTPGQIEVIRRKRVKRVYLALDPDAADEISRLVRALWGSCEVHHVVLPPGVKDLGEMSLEGARDAVLAAPPVAPWDMFFSFGAS